MFKNSIKNVKFPFLLLFLLFGIGCSTRKIDETPSSLLNQEQMEEESKTSNHPKGLKEESTSQNLNEYYFLKPSEESLVAPGDLISMSYPQDPKLNLKLRVNFNGLLMLPYNYKIKAIGLSVSQLQRLIQEKYADIYQNSTDIKIHISEKKRWLQITGDVSVTGLRLVDPGTDLTEILSPKNSQSFNSNLTEERKNLKYLKIKWNNLTTIIDMRKYFNSEISWTDRKWHGGEILSFQSSTSSTETEFPMIRVLGEVADPGAYPFTPEGDYFSYVLKAGGVTSSADIDRLYVIRGPPFHRETRQISLEDLNELGPPKENDTLIILRDRTSLTERRVEMWARFASIFSTLLLLKVIF